MWWRICFTEFVAEYFHIEAEDASFRVMTNNVSP